MIDIKALLKIKSDKRKTKPNFVRQNVGRIKEAGTKYRRPKGYQSKLRLGIKGKGVLPSCGYRSPKALRYSNKDGFFEVVVSGLIDLDKINKKTEVAVINSTVGIKKRIDILLKAKELGITIVNEKNVDDLKSDFKTAKKARADRNNSRKSVKKEVEKKESSKKEEPKDDSPKKESSKKEEPKDDSSQKESNDEIKKSQEKILIDKNKAI